MNYNPILIVTGEPNSVFLEIFFKAQKKYKISSTPTIYINEKKYEGNHEFKNFKKFLEKLL